MAVIIRRAGKIVSIVEKGVQRSVVPTEPTKAQLERGIRKTTGRTVETTRTVGGTTVTTTETFKTPQEAQISIRRESGVPSRVPTAKEIVPTDVSKRFQVVEFTPRGQQPSTPKQRQEQIIEAQRRVEEDIGVKVSREELEAAFKAPKPKVVKPTPEFPIPIDITGFEIEPTPTTEEQKKLIELQKKREEQIRLQTERIVFGEKIDIEPKKTITQKLTEFLQPPKDIKITEDILKLTPGQTKILDVPTDVSKLIFGEKKKFIGEIRPPVIKRGKIPIGEIGFPEVKEKGIFDIFIPEKKPFFRPETPPEIKLFRQRIAVGVQPTAEEAARIVAVGAAFAAFRFVHDPVTGLIQTIRDPVGALKSLTIGLPGTLSILQQQFVEEPLGTTAGLAGRVFFATRVFPKGAEIIKTKLGFEPSGLKILTKGMTKQQKSDFFKFLKTTKQLKKQPKVKRLKFDEVLTDPKMAKVFRQWAKDHDIIIGGSVGAKSQIKIQTRPPGDIDVFSSNVITSGQALLKAFREAGVKNVSLKISGRGKLTMSIRIFLKTKDMLRPKKLIEIHSNKWRTSFPFSKRPVFSPDGIRVMTIQEQAMRKIIGSYMGRQKDFPDLLRIAKSQFIEKEIGIRKGILPFKEARLESLAKLEAEFLKLGLKRRKGLAGVGIAGVVDDFAVPLEGVVPTDFLKISIIKKPPIDIPSFDIGLIDSGIGIIPTGIFPSVLPSAGFAPPPLKEFIPFPGSDYKVIKRKGRIAPYTIPTIKIKRGVPVSEALSAGFVVKPITPSPIIIPDYQLIKKPKPTKPIIPQGFLESMGFGAEPLKPPIPEGFLESHGFGEPTKPIIPTGFKPTPFPLPLKIKRKPRRKKLKTGYNVFIKSKGFFKQANRIPLPINMARNLGARITDKFASRSFTIQPSIKKTSLIDDKTFDLKRKFRRPVVRSKLPRRTLVERTAFAIDSIQEKLSISYVGLKTLRRLPQLRKRKTTRRKARKKARAKTTRRPRTRRTRR